MYALYTCVMFYPKTDGTFPKPVTYCLKVYFSFLDANLPGENVMEMREKRCRKAESFHPPADPVEHNAVTAGV